MTTGQYQYVDIEVTRQKFAQELQKFEALKEYYRSIGVLLLDCRYPDMYFGFATTKINPVVLLFGVRINFLNYDIEPLSVKFVHPITYAPLLYGSVGTLLLRKMEGNLNFFPLLQAQNDQVPFFCIPGVREFHNHPFHTGEQWFLYRGMNGEGSLCFILDNLQLYGTHPVAGGLMQVPVGGKLFLIPANAELIAK